MDICNAIAEDGLDVVFVSIGNEIRNSLLQHYEIVAPWRLGCQEL